MTDIIIYFEVKKCILTCFSFLETHFLATISTYFLHIGISLLVAQSFQFLKWVLNIWPECLDIAIVVSDLLYIIYRIFIYFMPFSYILNSCISSVCASNTL